MKYRLFREDLVLVILVLIETDNVILYRLGFDLAFTLGKAYHLMA